MNNSETRAPVFIDLLQEQRLFMGRRAGSGERGRRRAPVEAIAKDLGRGNKFWTIDWPSRGWQSGSKAGENGKHQEYCGNSVARSGKRGNPRQRYDPRGLVLLDEDFLVVQ